MKTIEIFDPAMCCPIGLCGPNINPNLMRIAAAVQFLQNQGVANADLLDAATKDEQNVEVESKPEENDKPKCSCGGNC